MSTSTPCRVVRGASFSSSASLSSETRAAVSRLERSSGTPKRRQEDTRAAGALRLWVMIRQGSSLDLNMDSSAALSRAPGVLLQ